MYTKFKNWYMKYVLKSCVLIGCERCKIPFILQINSLSFNQGEPFTHCPACGLRLNLEKGKNMLFVRYVDE